MKLVTICIAAFNAEKYIGKAVESALAQNYQNIEILICDDGSTDNTIEIIEAYKSANISILKNKNNLGYLRTFNKLLYAANGEYISFLDADDFIDERKILLQVDYLNVNPSVYLVGTGVFRTDESGVVVGQEKYPSKSSEITNHLNSHVGVCFCGSSVMIRKDIVTSIGGYREFFIGCPAEDYDWIRRISEQYECSNIDESLYFYRYADGSLTKKVHYDLKARHASEIAKFLSEQRTSKGEDSLMNNELSGLGSFFNNIENKYLIDAGLLYRKTAFEHAVNSDYRKSLTDLKKAFHHGRFNLAFIKIMVLISVVFVFPNELLLKLKNIFRLKNISNDLK
jgi:glycosyltransferase involved in cell wall biosynthesis